MDTPGRSCPTHYRYEPAQLAELDEKPVNETIFVIGGLYGNTLALRQILKLQQLDNDPTLIFNGDFNWFNKSSENYLEINNEVLQHLTIAGNVEKELINPNDSVGCGCGYPDWVDDQTVRRSNEIIQQLQKTAVQYPQILSALDTLPMAIKTRIGDRQILILHGDPESLAGWGLSYELLSEANHQQQLISWFNTTRVDIICCTHTCLPAIKVFQNDNQEKIIINNGAAGMGNLQNDSSGLLIRISTMPCPNEFDSSFQFSHADLFINLVNIHFDDAKWQQQFIDDWPAGSPAYESYFDRIQNGTHLQPNQITL